MKLIEALDIQLKDRLMLSIVGGGGKTTIMLRLAQELRSRRKRVLVTTTTHIYCPNKSLYDCFFWWNDIKKNVIELPRLEQASITVIASGITDDRKLVGISGECVDELYESNFFDAILVEADGAKGRPVKAPDTHEPVIPGLTSMLVGAIGMDCFGKPIDAAWVHRPQLFAALTGRNAGDIIDGAAIEKLVLSRDGLFKGCPGKAQKTLFLNKADSPELVLAAERTGTAVLKHDQGIERVLIGSILGDEPVISAAGR